MKTPFLVGLLTLYASCAFGAYPASYPLENEAFLPEMFPASTPSFSYDPETDVGGYIHYGPYTLTFLGGVLTEDHFPPAADTPYFTHQCRFAEYVLVAVFGAPPQLPPSLWNCTAKDIFFANADFTGVANGQKICDVGACCTALVGEVKFGEDQMDWHNWLDERLASALCGEVDLEMTYCILVGGHFERNCWEYYGSPDARDVYGMFPCYDNWAIFYLTCPVFKESFIPSLAFESPIYESTMTAIQYITNDCVGYLMDRICHPHSYYYPESIASSTTASGTTESAGGDSGESASAESDSAASFVSVVLALLSCL